MKGRLPEAKRGHQDFAKGSSHLSPANCLEFTLTLTPTLSPWERVKPSTGRECAASPFVITADCVLWAKVEWRVQRGNCNCRAEIFDWVSPLLPLPKGEGRGEGEGNFKSTNAPTLCRLVDDFSPGL